MANTRTAKPATPAAPIPGFKWTMAAVIEGPQSGLVPGAVVIVTTSKGRTEHVTIGEAVETFDKVGMTWVKAWPAARVDVTAEVNGNGSNGNA